MSIPSTINSIEEHIENAYDALALGGEDLTNVDKNLTNINLGLKNRYEDFLANGIDELWNNWENKSTQEETNLHFDNTIEAKMQIELKGNLNQNSTPTPDNPVDIEMATGNNTVNITGKNIYNATKIEGTINQLTYSADNQYLYLNGTATGGTSINFNNTMTLPAGKYRLMLKLVDGTLSSSSTGGLFYLYSKAYSSAQGLYLSSSNNYTSTGISIITNGEQIRINTWARKTETYTNAKIAYLVIPEPETGGIADYNFEPYKSQSQLLSLGNLELCKIGDYQDYIYKSDGIWYKHKVIAKVTLNGSEQWSSNTRTKGYQFDTNISGKLAGSNANIEVYSNRFRGIAFSSRDSITESIYTGNNDTRARILTNVASTSAAFKEWLELNNTIVYYVLATPTDEEITDTTLITQLNALKQAKSYNNVTNITQTNDNLSFIINATALLKNA